MSLWLLIPITICYTAAAVQQVAHGGYYTAVMFACYAIANAAVIGLTK